MDVNDLALGDEGVDFRVVDQNDPDAFGIEARRLDQRVAQLSKQQFGFAVTQDRLRQRWPRGGEKQQNADHE